MKITRSTPALFALLAAAALALTGCTGSADTSVSGTVWGDTAAKDTPSLTFKDDGTMSGTDGCNVLGGDWSQSGDTVKFEEIVSTLMFCEGIDDWLGDSYTAVVNGDKLTFSDKDGKEIGTLERARD